MTDERFKRILARTLEYEGGYGDDKRDRGGETKYGISKRSHPNVDVKNLTLEGAEEIYWRDYYAPNRYGEIQNEDLAAEVFDFAVNAGPATANRLLQKAVNETTGAGIGTDGILGRKSLDVINAHPAPRWLLDRFKLLEVDRYLDIWDATFAKGWLRRAIE